VLEEVKTILRDTLQLGDRARGFDADTRLLGSLPELDSMAVVTVITAIEERFGFTVEDDDISADTFETVGSLCRYVEARVGAG
jgi:acyl carrier protein